MKKIAIIGAGFSAATCAYLLKEHAQLEIFEKARSVGGRLCARYHQAYEFDFACPFFQITDPLFQDFLKDFDIERFVDDEYVGKPRMNTMVKQLLEASNVHLQTQVTRIEWDRVCHLYAGDQYLGEFDFCILSLVPQQCYDLIQDSSFKPYFLEAQWVFNLGLSTAYQQKIIYPKQCGIEKIVANHLKPGRISPSSLVAYMDTHWSAQHLEDQAQDLEAKMEPEFLRLLKLKPEDLVWLQAHRWRYARHKQAFTQNFIWQDKQPWAAIGDAYIKSDLESAFLSAHRFVQAWLNSSLSGT